MSDNTQWYNQNDNNRKKKAKKPQQAPAAKGKKAPSPAGKKMPAAKPAPAQSAKKAPAGKKVKPAAKKSANYQPVVTEQQKIMAREQKKAEEAKKLARENERKVLAEQAKMEKKKRSAKGNARKSAESRAIRNGILGAVAVIAGLFVLVFVVHHLFDHFAEKPKFSFVTVGAVEHTIGARALIVRDEIVINSENGGSLVTRITEGSRVAKAQELAMVVPDDMQSVVSDLRNVQSQISDVQQELISSGGVTEADVIYNNFNKNLSSVVDSIRFDSMTGNLSDLSSYSSSINVILDEREDELSNIDFDDERLSVLRDDEKVYESQLERDASRVFADRPGIASFRLDGQEEILNYDNFLGMNINDVKNAISSSVGAIPSDLEVEAGTPVVRIAQNESQYISVYLSSGDAAITDFAVGTHHDINVRSEGISIDNCEVVRFESDGSGMLITFETSRCVEDLLDLRTVDIEIVISETSGMRVSSSSVVDSNFVKTDTPAFSVFFPADSGISASAFAEGAIFNINVVPEPVYDEAGVPKELETTTVGAATVVCCEAYEDGTMLVAFQTMNDYSNMLKLSRLYPEGYNATFIDTATGLGNSCSKIMCTHFDGIGTLYVNNQGFVDAERIIILDHDREFVIVSPIGRSTVPDLDTVIITNPETVRPGDKVD
ncbi:MAG: hypothetical protein K5745_04250 [Saccharofermentans sp.]|nr:hypothetical protein [Saccharofermentans sp.]